jgi:hypothetical protein
LGHELDDRTARFLAVGEGVSPVPLQGALDLAAAALDADAGVLGVPAHE